MGGLTLRTLWDNNGLPNIESGGQQALVGAILLQERERQLSSEQVRIFCAAGVVVGLVDRTRLEEDKVLAHSLARESCKGGLLADELRPQLPSRAHGAGLDEFEHKVLGIKRKPCHRLGNEVQIFLQTITAWSVTIHSASSLVQLETDA